VRKFEVGKLYELRRHFDDLVHERIPKGTILKFVSESMYLYEFQKANEPDIYIRIPRDLAYKILRKASMRLEKAEKTMSEILKVKGKMYFSPDINYYYAVVFESDNGKRIALDYVKADYSAYKKYKEFEGECELVVTDSTTLDSHLTEVLLRKGSKTMRITNQIWDSAFIEKVIETFR